MTGRLAFVAVAALLALPAQALGGTVTRNASTVTYTGTATSGAGENVDLLEENGSLIIQSSLGFGSTDCPQTDTNRVECPPTPAYVVMLQNLDDNASGQAVTGATTMEGHGGAGNDRLVGTKNADRLYGDDGDDSLEGLEGNDLLVGGSGGNYFYDGAGDDTITGGPQGDNWIAGPGRDVFSGGDGSDRADYSARAAGVSLAANGQPTSGEPGEGDTISADTEDLAGGSGPDTLTGGPNGGYLLGGAGNDTIKGGPQSDRLEGNEGDDVIDARDGVYDSIDCGPGNDTVLADLNDSYENCETAPDRDGDGTLNEQDCAPDDPAVHPGAGEVYGNPIDEDCSGGPGYLQVTAGVTYDLKVKKHPARVRFRSIQVASAQGGDQVQVRCKGKGCAFKSKNRTVGAGKTSVSLASLFKKRFLGKGARVTVIVARENQIARWYTLTVTKKATIKLVRQCVAVGASSPSTCPAT